MSVEDRKEWNCLLLGCLYYICCVFDRQCIRASFYHAVGPQHHDPQLVNSRSVYFIVKIFSGVFHFCPSFQNFFFTVYTKLCYCYSNFYCCRYCAIFLRRLTQRSFTIGQQPAHRQQHHASGGTPRSPVGLSRRTLRSWGLFSLFSKVCRSFRNVLHPLKPPLCKGRCPAGAEGLLFYLTAGAVAKQSPRRTTWVEHIVADTVISINLQILFND